MRSATTWRALAAVALVAAMAGCASTASSPSSSERAANEIAVTVGEWSVQAPPGSAPAGEVTFSVTNNGPDDVHEFVILKTDLDAADLPTDEHGAVTEEGEGIEVIDEIEDIPVGETQEVTVTLEAGNYVLLCNIYDEEEDEAHYQMGMRTPFAVQ